LLLLSTLQGTPFKADFLLLDTNYVMSFKGNLPLNIRFLSYITQSTFIIEGQEVRMFIYRYICYEIYTYK